MLDGPYQAAQKTQACWSMSMALRFGLVSECQCFLGAVSLQFSQTKLSGGVFNVPPYAPAKISPQLTEFSLLAASCRCCI